MTLKSLHAAYAKGLLMQVSEKSHHVQYLN